MYYNCKWLIDNVITIAINWLTIILQLPEIDWQLYYNCQWLIDNVITIAKIWLIMLLQLPKTDW